MNITSLAANRYTTKAYDNSRKLDDEQLAQLQTLLRLAPSSTNAQPWHFVIVSSELGKEKLIAATSGPYSGNQAKVVNASHVVVLCARLELDEQHLQRVLEQEDADGRFKTAEAKEGQKRGRGFYVNLHREQGDTQQWMEKQIYIALGTLLLGAAGLGIDATPIEGFDRTILDEALGLRERGFTAVVLVALGYRSAEDPNAQLPKSRLPAAELFTAM